MANIKFSQFTVETAKADVDFLVGYSGADNVQISPTNLLSDYPTFTGAVGQVAFFDSTSSIGGDNDLYWDDTNKRLGIGTVSPVTTLHIAGTATPTIRIQDTTNNRHLQLFHDNDNSYIRSSTSSQIRFQTNGANDRMLIDTSGNVGIGTTTPSAKLDVDGTLIATGISQLGSSGSNVYLTSSSAGNVGIGTSSPNRKLHVVSSEFVVADFARPSGGNAYLSMEDATTTGSGYVGVGANGNDLTLRSGNVERARLTSSGNFGIGTTSPSAKLEIKTTTTNDGLLLSTGAPDNLNYANVFNSNSNSFPVGNISLSYGSNSTALINAQSNSMLLRGGSNATGYIRFNSFTTEVMRMTDVGLGIGMSSPSSKLEVQGGATLSAVAFSGPTVKIGDYSGIGNTRIFSNGSYIGYSTSNSYHDFSNSGTSQMRITSTGNVGIGTTSPDSLLHVAADVSGANIGTITIEGRPIGFLGDDIATIDFQNTGSKRADIRMERGSAINDSQLVFSTSDAGTLNDALIIKQTGNVGIGTTSPSSTLQVGNGSVDSSFRTYYDDNTYTELRGYGINFNRQYSYLRPTNDNNDFLYIGSQPYTWSELHLHSNTITFSDNTSEVMRINPGGNVGIGTTSPIYPLEVNGIIKTSSSFIGTTAIIQKISALNTNGIQFTNNGGSEKMRITDAGNVGIGTTTPAAALDVVGRIGLNDGNNNVSVGDNAGAAITTGTQNIIVGGLAGDALTTGALNVAIGHGALGAEDTGSGNVAVGYKALNDLNYDGSGYNIGVGYLAGEKITTGTLNVLIGGLAGDALTTGTNNVAIGYAALSTEDANGKNIAIGASALLSLNAGADAYNVAIGDQAGKSVTTGTQNVLIGGLAGDSLTSGNTNVAIGYQALTSETQGDRNVAIGVSALEAQNNTINADIYNVAVGYHAGKSMTTGAYNIIVGGLAGDALTTGTTNTIIGSLAGSALNTGGDNVVLGYQALTTEQAGGRNVAIGNFALQDLNTGSNAYNVAVGHAAGSQMTTGIVNTIMGGLAGDALTTGSAHVAVGYQSLSTEDAGNSCIAIGYQALLNQNVDGEVHNIAIGRAAGKEITTGTQNTIIGGLAGDALTTGTSNIIIGYTAAASAVGVSNEVSIYNGSVTARFQGAAAAWSFVSDARDKKDIEDLELGLNFIDKLKPRKFKWDLRDSSVDKDKEASGFIAQEVKEVLDEMENDYTGIVNTNNPDQYTVSQANIIPMLVKAIQELKQEIEQLKNKH